MLKLYCYNLEDEIARHMLETESWAELVQFVKILVSLHGYDFQTITTKDVVDDNIIMFKYSDSEFCFVTEDSAWVDTNGSVECRALLNL